MLALKWAFADKLHDYLYGNTFEVVTDNNPLTNVLSKGKLDATSHIWIAGKQNSDADGISRRPNIFSDSVKGALAVLFQEKNTYFSMT